MKRGSPPKSTRKSATTMLPNSRQTEEAKKKISDSLIRKQLGRPDTCEHCGINGLRGLKIHWANKSREYKRDLSDWLRLCVSCHKKYDSKMLPM